MYLVTTKTFGSLETDCICAEVTLAPVGVNGWHVHTTRKALTEILDAVAIPAVCGTRKTLEEAEALYAEACKRAREFVAAYSIE